MHDVVLLVLDGCSLATALALADVCEEAEPPRDTIPSPPPVEAP